MTICKFIEGCIKPACYNYEGLKPRFCKEHREETMVNVKVKFCIEKDCKIIASFNYKDQKTRLYCSIHKQEGMIKLHKEKTCKIDDCLIIPSFNFANLKPEYCKKHSIEGMVDLITKNVKQKVV